MIIDVGVELVGGFFFVESDVCVNIVMIVWCGIFDYWLVICGMIFCIVLKVGGKIKVFVLWDGGVNIVVWEMEFGMVCYVESDGSEDGWS